MEYTEKEIFELLEDKQFEDAGPLAMTYYGISVVDEKIEISQDSGIHHLPLEKICFLYDHISCYYNFYGPQEYAFIFYRELYRMVKFLPLKWHYYTKHLFCAHYLDMPKEKYFQIHAYYNRLFGDIWQFKHDKASHRKHEKIRIGYLSTDFRRHVVLLFIWVLLSKYNKDDFQVYCFSNGKEDDFTREIRKRVDCWVDIKGMKEPEAAKAIYSHEIDILFELGGHAHDNLPILAYKPAPVQICGIGYFATTGLKTVDYFLTDKYLMAGGAGKYFLEKPLVMPRSHFCFIPLNDMPKEIKGAPCLEKGYITFGSLNDPLKINQNLLKTWGRILSQVPGSRLFLKGRTTDTVKGRQELKQKLIEAGINLDRVDMEPFSMPYLEAYWKVDIALDTFPYPGGGTTCDALCMGCPVITLGDGTQGGDFGISLLKNTGLPELCAYSQEEYIQKAVALAKDKDRLEYLHRNLKRMFMESPICDGAGYMRDLEENYRRIWQEYLEPDKAYEANQPHNKKAVVNRVEDVLPYYEALIADLVPLMTKRILVFSGGNQLATLIKEKYLWAMVERLQDVGRDRLLQDCDVVEIEHFDWIIADGTMSRIQDDEKLIQAAGLHLAPYGKLRCIAIGSKESFTINTALHANGFTSTSLGDNEKLEDSDKAYILCAEGFFGTLVWLQQYYNEEVRREIGFLLSRIDFDIDPEESVVKLQALCQKQDIQPNYLRTFVESATINKEKVMAMLGIQVGI